MRAKLGRWVVPVAFLAGSVVVAVVRGGLYLSTQAPSPPDSSPAPVVVPSKPEAPKEVPVKDGVIIRF